MDTEQWCTASVRFANRSPFPLAADWAMSVCTPRYGVAMQETAGGGELHEQNDGARDNEIQEIGKWRLLYDFVHEIFVRTALSSETRQRMALHPYIFTFI